MKKVLLLGDSIRLNYMPMVFRLLNSVADVVGPEDNCRFAKYTLFNVNLWLKEFGTPDVIHWNNGLWDVSHESRDKTICLSSPDEYLRDIELVLNELEKTGAKIIFATSTPVRVDSPTFNNEDIIKYNAVATELMKKRKIEINDLHSFVLPFADRYINDEDKVHLNKEGIKAVGTEVASVIKKYL